MEQLGKQSQKLLQAGISPEIVAREMVAARNAIKLETRAMGGWLQHQYGNIRNFFKYGNKAGPSADQLFQKYGSWEKVIEKVTETNKTINKITGN